MALASKGLEGQRSALKSVSQSPGGGAKAGSVCFIYHVPHTIYHVLYNTLYYIPH